MKKHRLQELMGIVPDDSKNKVQEDDSSENEEVEEDEEMDENKENYSLDSDDSDSESSEEEDDLRGVDRLQSKGMDIPVSSRIPVVS